MPDGGALNTVTLSDGDRGVRAAVGLLAAGGLVAFPTETVYGLGADARSARAVAGVYAAKGRPSFNPLIVHVADRPAAEALATFPASARRLADRFWPGPLTLVLPRRPDAGLAEAPPPASPPWRCGCPPIPSPAACSPPSAARWSVPPPTPPAGSARRRAPTSSTASTAASPPSSTAAPARSGSNSTIVGFEDDRPLLLRPGGLPREAIEAALGQPLAERPDGAVTAPGQLASHYAPTVSVRLEAEAPRPGEVWLGFGPDGPPDALNLSPSGDLAEAAANLFAHLRAADARAAAAGARAIAIAPVPRRGLGLAINDRLARAAAPRPR